MADQIADATLAEDPLVPGWLDRLAAIAWRVVAMLALAVVLLAIFVQLATVIASIIVALVLTATLAPWAIRRRARGDSRGKAAAVVSLGALLVVGAVVALVVVAVVPSLNAILSAFGQGLDEARGKVAPLGAPADVGPILQRVSDAIRGFLAGGIADVAAAAASLVTIAVLGGFLTFFLLMDGDRSWAWLLAATDGWRRDALMTGGQRALDQVGGYVRGTTLIAIGTGVLAGVLLSLLRVPLAGPLAVIAGLGAMIPYVGRPVIVLLIVTIALASLGLVAGLVLLVLFVLGSLVLERRLSPFTGGRRLALHPILAVVGLPLGLAFGGFAGLVVILPLLAVAQTAAGVLVTALGREPPTESTATKPSSGSAAVPVWLDRLGQWSWRLLVVIAMAAVAAAVAVLLPGIILPVVIAVVLAATLAPAAVALERRGLDRGRAAMAVTVAMVVVVLGVVTATLATLAGSAAQVASTATAGANSSGAQAVGVGSFVFAVGRGTTNAVAAAAANLVEIVVVLLLGGFLTFYFIRDGARVWLTLTDWVPADRRSRLDAAGNRAVHVLGGYMVGTAAISLFGAVTQWLIMAVLGLPLALPLAVLALFGGFIPYIGSLIATGLAFFVAVAVGDSTDVVVMGIYTAVFNIVQGNFVAPLVYGKAVSLHPAIVLLAVPIGNSLAGIVGMFLVVPVAGVIATTWRQVLETIDSRDPVDALARPAPSSQVPEVMEPAAAAALAPP